MNTQRWNRINRLFSDACDFAPDARDRFLLVECTDDPSLVDEVKALLQSDQLADAHLDGVVRHAAAALTDGSRDRASIGPYRRIREIGQGGMGAVYLAERVDGGFEQQVALKLIRRGMDSEQILRRFRLERQILARLQHPNIARLLDGGVAEDGQPWFAMEYVEGEAITRYCDHHTLSIDQRLALFKDVCRAVAYAHASLVVHRDLKPDNILVTAKGEVRLLDFGIAKMLSADPDDDGHTQVGLQALTPAYASPEQVRGEPVSTATDIYSLGVILYHLLSGSAPYDITGRSMAEVERVVCHTDPHPPSARAADSGADAATRARGTDARRLRKRLDGDLDVICLKALAKEPARRYATVDALLEDLERHLTGRPVRARPDTLGYRLRKGLVRHRVAVGTTAALLLTSSILIGFYTGRLAAERNRAQQEAAKAGEVASFLRTLFEVTDPSQAQGDTITARALLDRGAQQLGEGLANQPEVQATMMRVVGEVYGSLGLSAQSEPLLRDALARHRQLYGESHDEVATSQVALAVHLQDKGDVAAAEPLFRQALATRERLHGRESAPVAEALGHLAFLVETNGAPIVAESLFRETMSLTRAVHPPDDPRVATALTNLGGFLRRIDKRDEAEPLLREGLALQRRTYGNRHPRVASSARNLAALLRDNEAYAEAESLYLEVLATRRAVLGNDHPEVAIALNSYALLLQRKGDTGRAIATFTEFIGMLDRIHREPHPSQAAAYSNLAQVLKDEERFDEAATLFRRSMSVQDRVLAPNHPNRAHPLIGLAQVYAAQERHGDAEPLIRTALTLRRNALRAGHRDIGDALSDLGFSLTALRRFREADSALAEAHRILLASEGAASGRTRRAARRVAALYDAWGKPDQAREFRVRLLSDSTSGSPRD
jgi:serine/threonine-protein kinase